MSRSLKMKLKLEGSLFETSRYGKLQILKYNNAKNVEVVFLNTGYITTVQMDNIYNDKVKDRMFPSVYGVGILGDSLCKIDKTMTTAYKHWESMIHRCYSEDYLKKRPTYRGCEVSDNFKYLPYFEHWCSTQIGFGNEGWHLDKDILVKGNKVYSEDTCCFVPISINSLLNQQKSKRGDFPIGVDSIKGCDLYRTSLGNSHLGCFKTSEEAFIAYKQAKEDYIKEVANKWKDQIDPRVYEALMKWEVNIND